MHKMSPQSKSFIILAGLAVVGTYLCLMLWAGLISDAGPGFEGPITYSNEMQLAPGQNAANAAAPGGAVEVVPKVDTSAWKTFTNKEYGISFKYDPSWKILKPVTKSGYTVFQVDPGPKYYNIKIYVSQKDYYLMGGLPVQTETIGGKPAQNVNGQLYGILANGFYYTFDIGWSMSLVPQFQALVHSVSFGG